MTTTVSTAPKVDWAALSIESVSLNEVARLAEVSEPIFWLRMSTQFVLDSGPDVDWSDTAAVREYLDDLVTGEVGGLRLITWVRLLPEPVITDVGYADGQMHHSRIRIADAPNTKFLIWKATR